VGGGDALNVPRVDAGGVELFYESLGEGMPLVLQGHDHTPWIACQAPYFSQRYRFLTYDRRGTGRSASNEPQETLEGAYEWHQQMAGSEFVVLRDCYHAAHRENALLWNQAVHGFLERHGLGGARD